MGAKTSCEESVAIAYLYYVAFARVCNGKDACHTFCPVVQVVVCVCVYDGFARSARGCVYASYLRHWCSLQSEGIFISKVVLCGEGEQMYVVY